MNSGPRAPGGLGAAGRRLWRSITRDYDLSAAEIELLGQCCRTVDALARIDEVLADAELVTAGYRGQPVPHPLLAAAADQRRALDGLLRSLALPMPDEDTGRRRSPTARAAAQARWRTGA